MSYEHFLLTTHFRVNEDKKSFLSKFIEKLLQNWVSRPFYRASLKSWSLFGLFWKYLAIRLSITTHSLEYTALNSASELLLLFTEIISKIWKIITIIKNSFSSVNISNFLLKILFSNFCNFSISINSIISQWFSSVCRD